MPLKQVIVCLTGQKGKHSLTTIEVPGIIYIDIDHGRKAGTTKAFLIDFNTLIMTADIFFKIYIPSLEKALEESCFDNSFSAKGPDWWFPEEKYKEMDVFEQDNSLNYTIFSIVADYFDALAHNQKEVNGIVLGDLKLQIKEIIRQYKETSDFNLFKNISLPKP